jgi:hypothetical protein
MQHTQRGRVPARLGEDGAKLVQGNANGYAGRGSAFYIASCCCRTLNRLQKPPMCYSEAAAISVPPSRSAAPIGDARRRAPVAHNLQLVFLGLNLE